MVSRQAVLNLVFHGILESPTRIWHLSSDAFARYWEILVPALLPSHSSPRVFISFDDGLSCSYDGFVRARGDSSAKATWFVVTERVGSSEKHLGWSDLRKMQRDGQVIGSHSRSHISLLSVTESVLKAELRESKQRIEDKLGQSCTDFAAPFGHLNRRVVDVAFESGYEEVYSTIPGWDAFTTPFRKRTTVSQSTTHGELEALLSSPPEQRREKQIAVVFSDDVPLEAMESVAAADNIVCCSDEALRLCADFALAGIRLEADRSCSLPELAEHLSRKLKIPVENIVVQVFPAKRERASE